MPTTTGLDVMVVLDHSGARIFQEGHEDSQPIHVVPLDPHGHDQQVHNSKGDSGGNQGPHRKLFYEALVKQLKSAKRVFLVGDGQGSSSEIEQFVAEVKEHHSHDLGLRIAGTGVVDISHMTDGDFRAKARELFAP